MSSPCNGSLRDEPPRFFAWKDGAVLKLFRGGTSRQQARLEARVTQAVHAYRLPVPRVGNLVEVGARVGLIYKRLDGPTLLDTLQRSPWTLVSAARHLARLHAQILARHVGEDLPEQRAQLARKIRTAERLPEAVRSAALTALDRLPTGDVLCHGDFHPRNVVMTAADPSIIDWIDATRGHPCADLARTLLLARFALPPRPRGLRLWICWMTPVYLREVRRLTGLSLAGVEARIPVIAAARVEEGVDETPHLIALAR